MFSRSGLAAAILLLGQAVAAHAEPAIVGRASVVDGDKIEIGGERIRLGGIDAPEVGQDCAANGAKYPCGQAAADALDTFLAESRPTRCEFVARDRHKRFVGNCFRADGKSVARWMVRNGWALDWPVYSKFAYAREQADAKEDGLGMWQGKFRQPWKWRRAMRKVSNR